MITRNRVSNTGKRRYRADGGGVREHVSSTIEALIANAVGTRLQQVPLYIEPTGITAGCSSVTLITRNRRAYAPFTSFKNAINMTVLKPPPFGRERLTSRVKMSRLTSNGKRVLEPSPLGGERLIECNRVSNSGKSHYRADGGGVREHVSRSIEALITNTVGT